VNNVFLLVPSKLFQLIFKSGVRSQESGERRRRKKKKEEEERRRRKKKESE
jgi:hypothetical protein